MLMRVEAVDLECGHPLLYTTRARRSSIYLVIVYNFWKSNKDWLKAHSWWMQIAMLYPADPNDPMGIPKICLKIVFDRMK